MSKCLVLFVEGDTESNLQTSSRKCQKATPCGRFDTNIEYRNVRGVGGF